MSFSRHDRCPWLALLLLTAVLSSTSLAQSASVTDEGGRSSDSPPAPFVIETDVFAGGEKEPVESHVTLFTEAMICDVRTHPDRFYIAFDRASRRFQIGRTQPPMQTSLTADDLIRFSFKLQRKAKDSSDPIVRFAAEPSFKKEFDSASGTLSLTSRFWDYHVQSNPMPEPTMRKRYREFSDWFSYLNSIFRPLPSGARLELNRLLDQYRIMPTVVTVQLRSGGQRFSQRSEHRLLEGIGSEHQQWLDDWKQQQSKLPIVEFARFHAASRR